ncbi:MAG: DUF2953 domain-containing protein [Ruminococcaceae bacterium]|nr:DUF2953 domain-containing protein [Oscillospiraceae bacterium]
MTALLVIGIIILLFIGLLSLKATITVAYSDEVRLSVKVLFFRIRILPKKEKKGPHSMSAAKAEKIRKKARKKAEKKRLAAKEKAKKKADHKFEKKKPKKSISEILDMLTMIRSIAAEVIRRFFGHLRIDIARLKLTIATGDAATTAIAYGAVTQSVNLLFPVLEQVKNFSLPQTADLDIQADFTAEESEADVELSFSLRVWHVFHVAFGALGKFLKHRFQAMSRQ